MTIAESPDALSCGLPLSADLDAWTRHVVRRHFDAVDGSPFWLKRREALGFDPFDITRYEELTAFGSLSQNVLRAVDPIDMLPQGLQRPLSGRVFESGGTKGKPFRVFHTGRMAEHRATWRRLGLREAGFETGRTWIHATPGGPRPVGQGATHTAYLHASMVYGIDFDSRWIRRLIKDARLMEVNRYVDHAVGQLADILGATRVDYLETTPALFQALLRLRPELAARLSGVGLSGSRILPVMYRQFAEALDGGVIAMSYENAFGSAMGLPVEADGDVLPYLPHYPQVTMAVVDKTDPTRLVDYGELGQLRLTVLHEDLFLPNVLENDQAVRYRTGADWPCDGVANIQPLQPPWAVPDGNH